MANLIADLDRCQGYANCVIAAPDLFDLSDANQVEIVGTVDAANLAEAQEAVSSCPVAALRLEQS